MPRPTPTGIDVMLRRAELLVCKNIPSSPGGLGVAIEAATAAAGIVHGSYWMQLHGKGFDQGLFPVQKLLSLIVDPFLKMARGLNRAHSKSQALAQPLPPRQPEESRGAAPAAAARSGSGLEADRRMLRGSLFTCVVAAFADCLSGQCMMGKGRELAPVLGVEKRTELVKALLEAKVPEVGF